MLLATHYSASLLLATVLLTLSAACERRSLTFEDGSLEAALVKELDKMGAQLTQNSLSQLRELDLRQQRIYDLSGLEACSNLQILDLGNSDPVNSPATINLIADLTPISHLQQLRVLRLEAAIGRFTSLEPIATLPNLEELDLSTNGMREIYPLHKLSSLKILSLRGNGLRSLYRIEQLTSLVELDLAYNEIRDLSSLVELARTRPTNAPPLRIHIASMAYGIPGEEYKLILDDLRKANCELITRKDEESRDASPYPSTM